MQLLHKVVVGSRLHGLNTNDSDFDYRGVFKVPLKDYLSPFKKTQNTSWIEGKDDDTSFELINFLKMAVSGNPTILEIIWSNQIIETTTEFQELKANSLKLLDDFKIYNAHLGYSQNQIKKMGFDESNSKNIRTYKTVIAYIRSLRQGRELLETGSFNPVYEYPDRDFLMELKTDFKTEMMGKAATIMKQVREEFEETFNNLKHHRKPDLEWIEDFILRTYLEKS